MGAEISIAVALVSLIDKLGGWGIGSIMIAVFVVPPVLAFFGVRSMVKALHALSSQIKVSEAQNELLLIEFAKRYENNVVLVQESQKTAAALLDIIRRNTIAMTKLVDRIDQWREK